MDSHDIELNSPAPARAMEDERINFLREFIILVF